MKLSELIKRYVKKVKVGMTREEVVAILGKPADTGGTSRKYPLPTVYVYGATGNSRKGVELRFTDGKHGVLHAAWNPAKHKEIEIG
jgi:outer membrane protein assembly factor BamE (lipoprotein component of BamABCDE complex)